MLHHSWSAVWLVLVTVVCAHTFGAPLSYPPDTEPPEAGSEGGHLLVPSGGSLVLVEDSALLGHSSSLFGWTKWVLPWTFSHLHPFHFGVKSFSRMGYVGGSASHIQGIKKKGAHHCVLSHISTSLASLTFLLSIFKRFLIFAFYVLSKVFNCNHLEEQSGKLLLHFVCN